MEPAQTFQYSSNAWENKTLEYDLDRFNWPQWILSVIQEIEPDVVDLCKFHDVVPLDRLVQVQRHVQQSFSRLEFMQRYDDFAELYLKSLLDNQPYLLKRQPTLNVVLPNQDRLGRRLTFHTGIMVSNGRGQGTIWMPLTRCGDTNSMWIADLESSRRLNRRCIENQWSMSVYEKECLKISSPVELVPGQAHLFHQEHVHGNVNNETGYTRMAIDWHVLPLGGEYKRRLPGGFFRLPGDHAQGTHRDYSCQSFVSYLNHSTDFTRGIPAVCQRMLIDNYCKQNKIIYSFHNSELEFFDWCPLLEHMIQQGPDGIVMPSIYSLPTEPARRNYLLDLAGKNKVVLHFANEICDTHERDSVEKIKTYLEWGIEKLCAYSWE